MPKRIFFFFVLTRKPQVSKRGGLKCLGTSCVPLATMGFVRVCIRSVRGVTMCKPYVLYLLAIERLTQPLVLLPQSLLIANLVLVAHWITRVNLKPVPVKRSIP